MEPVVSPMAELLSTLATIVTQIMTWVGVVG